MIPEEDQRGAARDAVSCVAEQVPMSRLIVVAAIIALATAEVVAQGTVRGDRSQPPGVAASTEGFTVRQLTAPVTIDGRAWIAIESVSTAGSLWAPNGRFTLTLEEAKDHTGDVVRFRVFFTEGGGGRIQLEPEVAAYAFISPDSRWIVSDPLEVIDVLNWRRYSLSKSFKINPYVVLKAISADGRRLFITRHVCPFDCQNIPLEYFEIGFPPIAR